MADFVHQKMFEHGEDTTDYRRLDGASAHVTTEAVGNRTIVRVGGEALRLLAAEAFDDVSHLLRSSHLAQLRKIMD